MGFSQCGNFPWCSPTKSGGLCAFLPCETTATIMRKSSFEVNPLGREREVSAETKKRGRQNGNLNFSFLGDPSGTAALVLSWENERERKQKEIFHLREFILQSKNQNAYLYSISCTFFSFKDECIIFHDCLPSVWLQFLHYQQQEVGKSLPPFVANPGLKTGKKLAAVSLSNASKRTESLFETIIGTNQTPPNLFLNPGLFLADRRPTLFQVWLMEIPVSTVLNG